MRTFQYSDATSHKFWNIEVAGNSFTVTYGKIGSAGQTQTKTFPTAQKAQAEADKRVAEKTKKGYVETTASAAASEAEAFVRAIRENPHDVAAASAYADWLVERNDPRGEFMQVHLALENESLPKDERKKLQAREKALLKKHERDWLDALDHCADAAPCFDSAVAGSICSSNAGSVATTFWRSTRSATSSPAGWTHAGTRSTRWRSRPEPSGTSGPSESSAAGTAASGGVRCNGFGLIDRVEDFVD